MKSEKEIYEMYKIISEKNKNLYSLYNQDKLNKENKERLYLTYTVKDLLEYILDMSLINDFEELWLTGFSNDYTVKDVDKKI